MQHIKHRIIRVQMCAENVLLKIKFSLYENSFSNTMWLAQVNGLPVCRNTILHCGDILSLQVTYYSYKKILSHFNKIFELQKKIFKNILEYKKTAKGGFFKKKRRGAKPKMRYLEINQFYKQHVGNY